MILILMTALAAAADLPVPAEAVDCLRAVHFSTPYRWNWSAEHSAVVDATALVVRADPELLRPRDIGQRVLYVEGWPAEILAREADRALILAPVALPAGPVRVWFGGDTLPERVDARQRLVELGTVVRMPGTFPRAAAEVAEEPPGSTRTHLVDRLTSWMQECQR